MNNILREYQEEELKILKEVKEILYSKNINFFLIGGTLLGAIRHGGFIPWDDDIDIGIMRKDFEILEKELEKENNKLIKYFSIGKNKYQTEPIGRVYLKAEIKNENIKKIVDIFPIDNIPQNKFLQKIHYLISEIYRLTIYKKPAKNRGVLINNLSKIILKILPEIILRMIEKVTYKFMTSLKLKNTKYVANIFGAKGYFKEIMPREYIETSVLWKFEGEDFYIPRNWDKYLQWLYGNYMELPPKELQKPHHIDLKCIEKKEELEGKK